MHNIPTLINTEALLEEYVIVLYDGMCGFCDQYVQFILNQHPDSKLRFVSYQSNTAKKIIAYNAVSDDLSTMRVMEKGQVYQKSKAFFKTINYLNSPWAMLSVLQYIPSFITDIGYDIVAKYRYKILGNVEQCRVLSQHERRLFIE